MGDLIRVNFRRGRLTLLQAKEFLGHNYFNQALSKWSLQTLEQAINHPEAVLSGASDAYEVIYRHRLSRSITVVPAPVILLRAA